MRGGALQVGDLARGVGDVCPGWACLLFTMKCRKHRRLKKKEARNTRLVSMPKLNSRTYLNIMLHELLNFLHVLPCFTKVTRSMCVMKTHFAFDREERSNGCCHFNNDRCTNEHYKIDDTLRKHALLTGIIEKENDNDFVYYLIWMVTGSSIMIDKTICFEREKEICDDKRFLIINDFKYH